MSTKTPRTTAPGKSGTAKKTPSKPSNLTKRTISSSKAKRASSAKPSAAKASASATAAPARSRSSVNGARLVIVESPAKARTIEKYLGRGYAVRASMGHVRDLPKSTLGVEVEHDFQPKYLIPADKKETVKE